MSSFKNVSLSLNLKLSMFFALVLFNCQSIFAQEDPKSVKHSWGISASLVKPVAGVKPMKLGSGSEYRLWHHRGLGNNRKLMLSIGYKKLIGFDLQASHSTTYSYPTIYTHIFESTRLGGLRYVDLELGLRRNLEESAFSYGISLHFSNLLSVDGGVSETIRYHSIEIYPSGSSRFIRSGTPNDQSLNKNDFNRFDIGTQFHVFYEISPSLTAKAGVCIGFREIFKDSLFNHPMPFYNASMSLGFLAQL